MQGKYTGEALEQTLDNSAEHIKDKNNPHKVTPEQLGLGDAIRARVINKVEYDASVDGKQLAEMKVQVEQMQTALTNKINNDVTAEANRAKAAEKTNADAITALTAKVISVRVLKSV